ncbi:hypothetical protein [Pseudooceanicola nanhaiensis]|uniref:hypothetical protein n=1 Tax=Pseudooceanicola nanhaiensis TaxID=375761 RepID=UPI001CD74072|nr:hypothetical protein [Pseudooceanicola nanhaiensis]MCA0922779.1 hypothetical protein [Pseudooceanicola nanhaiensis]
MDGDRSDILLNGYGFDPVWYCRQYGDVGRDGLSSGLTPADHYLALGRHLGRPAHGDLSGAALAAELEGLEAALSARPVLSYCIPVLDRFDLLRTTLPDILKEQAPRAGQVEILVMVFDADRAVIDWVRAQFPEALRSGFLRVRHSDALSGWHFGIAKNAFRSCLSGQVYASLDADNVPTLEETDLLLALHEQHPGGFLFHHFSGVWGDGSSGRVSLPAALYRRVGYDERFMPRQFDEIDLILGCLSARPGLPYFCYDTEETALSSENILRFLAAQGLDVAPHRLPFPARIAALDAKEADYVQTDPVIRAMHSYNEAACYYKLAALPEDRNRHLVEMKRSAQRFIQAVSAETLGNWLFQGFSRLGTGQGTRWRVRLPARAPLSGHRCLEVWSAQGEGPPVGHALQPRFGHADTARDLWLGALKKALQAQGDLLVED